jgi:hypothetical protein
MSFGELSKKQWLRHNPPPKESVVDRVFEGLKHIIHHFCFMLKSPLKLSSVAFKSNNFAYLVTKTFNFTRLSVIPKSKFMSAASQNTSKTNPQAIKVEKDKEIIMNKTQMISNIKDSCIKGVPSWNKLLVASEDLVVAPVSGGCSNYIFRVSLNNNSSNLKNIPANNDDPENPSEVLVRLFGTGLLDLGIDRETEIVRESHASQILKKFVELCLCSFYSHFSPTLFLYPPI